MLEMITSSWPIVFTLVSVVLGTAAAIHAMMSKRDVRSATAWVGIVVLSPLVGAILYFIAGINRMRRQALIHRHARASQSDQGKAGFKSRRRDRKNRVSPLGGRMIGMTKLGDTVTGYELTPNNKITLLDGGDETYARFIELIDAATKSIWLESYIFDHDRIGLRIAARLIEAVRRGVEVRVIVDAVGARYTIPTIVSTLRAGGVRTRSFNGHIIIGLRLPYANMRTHRKVMIVDGHVALTGGMNIDESYTREWMGENACFDTHFEVYGPVVADLALVFAEDWQFADGETLDLPEPTQAPDGTITARVVATGPDSGLEINQQILLGAFSVAEHSILIMSPYFLPDNQLTSALVTAGLRGVSIDIVVPDESEFTLIDFAMIAQFELLIGQHCRVWRSAGRFNHSKLMTIDNQWSYIGSSNIDSRSLRLNFEVDLEIHDRGFAEMVAARIIAARDNARQVTKSDLDARPFALRLLHRLLWLGSPYL